jgi:hypothetical protein
MPNLLRHLKNEIVARPRLGEVVKRIMGLSTADGLAGKTAFYWHSGFVYTPDLLREYKCFVTSGLRGIRL